MEQLSWHPRAWLYHNFLTPEECKHLIEKARLSVPQSRCAALTPAHLARHDQS